MDLKVEADLIRDALFAFRKKLRKEAKRLKLTRGKESNIVSPLPADAVERECLADLYVPAVGIECDVEKLLGLDQLGGLVEDMEDLS